MKTGTGVIETGTLETDAAIDITVGRSEEFDKQTKALSGFIKALPLDRQQNNDLIDEIIKHLIIGENDAFKYGMSIGVELGKSLEPEREGV